MNPNPTPYSELNEVLGELVGSMQTNLGETFIGAYLQGSFAVGGFDEHSDVDFIVAIEDELTDAQVESLQRMHARIYDQACEWAKHLEGSYFPKTILKRADQSGKPLWYLDNGARSMIRDKHCNTLVVRHTAREHGVPLAGPAPTALIDPVPVELLREEILEVMNWWWGQIKADPEQINNHFYQTFAVLSYCRMLHDYRYGTVSSKRTSAEWAKANLDPTWRGLIDRTWAGRPDPARSVCEPADPEDLKLTLAFIEYVIGESTQPIEADLE